MPTRHGAMLRPDRAECLLGIWSVFDPWIEPELLIKQGYNIQHDEKRPAYIAYHFGQVVQRLVRSLVNLDRSAREYDRFLDEGGLTGPNPSLVFEIPETAGIAADAIFHYLNLFIDDLGRMVPFVLVNEGDAPPSLDGFPALKRALRLRRLPTTPLLLDLFDELDRDDSWFALGFKFGVGMRQRLTHYDDILNFSASTKPGATKMTADVRLISIGGPVHQPDFEGTLRALFSGLCEWLDKLDHLLLVQLAEQLERKNIRWDPFAKASRSLFLTPPEGLPPGASHYRYLPIVT